MTRLEFMLVCQFHLYVFMYAWTFIQISPPKSSISNPCLWNCLCWEVYYCHSACTEAKFTKCITGRLWMSPI